MGKKRSKCLVIDGARPFNHTIKLPSVTPTTINFLYRMYARIVGFKYLASTTICFSMQDTVASQWQMA